MAHVRRSRAIVSAFVFALAALMKNVALRISFLALVFTMAAHHVAYAQVAPPTISKAFGALQTGQGFSVQLTFNIGNPNGGTALTGVAFTDPLPAGLIVDSPNGLTGSCGGGTITATSGSSTITLSGATLAAGASCTFSVFVVAEPTAVQETETNTTGNVTSTNGGTGLTATASITVIAAPVKSKVFGASTIPLNGTTSLTFSIANPNTTVTLTGVSVLDTLPAGLVVATPNGLTGSCGGGTITAVAGSTLITLSGATLAPGASCSFSVNVLGTTPGVKSNSVRFGSNELAEGTGTAQASITVVAPVVPTLNESGKLIFGLLVASAGLLLLVRRR